MAQEGAGGRQGGRLGGEGGGVGGAQGVKSAAEDEVRTAGRGFAFITGAKLWFMVMGAIVNIGLPVIMSPETYGVYSIVVNAVSLINMVVITGTLQAVAKLVSERPEAAAKIVGRAALLQWFVAVPLGIAWIFGADTIAGFFSDESLGSLLAISGGVILAYGFYAVFVGCFNGLKAFGRQAVLDVAFSTLKTGLIVGAVLAGFGVAGALWGFVIAAAVVTVLSAFMLWRFMGQRRSGESSSLKTLVGGDDLGADLRKLLVYLVLVMLYTFCVNGVLRADLFLLKSLVGQEGSVELANRISGVYTAMLNISRLPYQAVIAVTFVIFPMISKATFEEDQGATRAYIRGAMRYSFILLGLLSALLAGNASDVVLALFGEKYSAGGLPLMVLSVATVGFSLFFIATTMITGAGRPWVSVVLAAVVLAVTAGLNYVLIDGALAGGAIDEQTLAMRASMATAAAMVLGFVLSVAYLVWRYQAGLPLGTFARVMFAGAVVVGLTLVTPGPADAGRLVLLALVCGKGLLGTGLFVGALWASGEFGQEDRDKLRRVLRRGGPQK